MSDSDENPTDLRCNLRQIEYGVFWRPKTRAWTPASSSTRSTSRATPSMARPCSSFSASRRRSMAVRAVGLRCSKASSSSSEAIEWMPIDRPSGA